jgi:hypothetical protein
MRNGLASAWSSPSAAEFDAALSPEKTPERAAATRGM